MRLQSGDLPTADFDAATAHLVRWAVDGRAHLIFGSAGAWFEDLRAGREPRRNSGSVAAAAAQSFQSVFSVFWGAVRPPSAGRRSDTASVTMQSQDLESEPGPLHGVSNAKDG
jgi:hypothetical protein